ncbi:hypothetical protein EAI_12302 [Harpegnathos saltator]|uniref:Uncharacterized protein n=1 Tax=Harpegnathos saltator TaxID=610380 RepID=E2BST8_HARSA|nr:hypothetical protein EAI_12302 [Harpegnathos saltator]
MGRKDNLITIRALFSSSNNHNCRKSIEKREILFPTGRGACSCSSRLLVLVVVKAMDGGSGGSGDACTNKACIRSVRVCKGLKRTCGTVEMGKNDFKARLRGCHIEEGEMEIHENSGAG